MFQNENCNKVFEITFFCFADLKLTPQSRVVANASQ